MNIFKLRREIKDLQRLEQIFSILGNEGYHFLLSKIDLVFFTKHKKNALPNDKISEPKKVRELLEKLGPTFVKLGQLLSLRSDLIPIEYCEEFAKLQDDVKPFPFEKVQDIIEKQLKNPLSKLFKSVNKKPLSAASIGQVHRAKLFSGEEVIIKVQRPSASAIMQSDIDILEEIAKIFEKHQEFNSIKPSLIVQEFKDYTIRELDYRYELKNLKKFATYFAKWKTIGIPKPYSNYCTQNVLVMEYIDGIKLKELDKIKKGKFNLKSIGYEGFKAVFYQVFDLGLVHGDPHPSNLILSKKGVLYFIDFGIVGYVSENLKKNVMKFILFLLNKNLNKCVKSFLDICKIDKKSKVDLFRSDAERLMNEWYGTGLDEMRFTRFTYELIKSASKYNIQVPTDVILIAKSLLTIEGTGIILDPEFNITQKTKPLMNKILLKNYSPKKIADKFRADGIEYSEMISELPQRAENLLEKVEHGELSFKFESDDLKQIELNMDRNSSKRSISVLIGMIFIGSGIYANVINEPFLLGYPISLIGFVISIILTLILIVILLKDNNGG